MVLPFALQMATQQWCEFHGTAKRPSCILMWTTNVILLGVKQGERVWPQVEIASLLCADWIFFFFFFLVCIIFQCDDYLNIFFFPKQAGTRTHWLRWPCAVKEPASWGMGSAVRAQGGWGVPGLGCCAPSTLREAVSPEWRRHHRTTPFNLKSAGFKALCWQ